MSGETAPEDVHTMAEPGSAAPAAGEPGKGKRPAVLAAKAFCGCCCGCCCLLVLYVLFTLLWAFTLAVDSDGADAFTNVEITYDGVTFGAFYKAPSTCSAASPCPVAMIFHEWNGLNAELMETVNLLHETANVVVFVPDLFRGQTSASFIYNLYHGLYKLDGKRSQMDADADAALAWVRAKPEVDASKVISGGFCFGGSEALLFSMRNNVSATWTAYGSNIAGFGEADADDEKWGFLGEGHPLLGVYGENDTRPSPEEVEAFKAVLAERKVDAELKIYPDVGHAFVSKATVEDGKFSSCGQCNCPGNGGQCHGSAKDAWADILAFIQKRGASRALSDGAERGWSARADEKSAASQRERCDLDLSGGRLTNLPPPAWRTNYIRRFVTLLVNGCAGE
jgi:carboxymethylenebutenolidase